MTRDRTARRRPATVYLIDQLDAATIDRLARAIVRELGRPVEPIESFLRFRRDAVKRQRRTTKAGKAYDDDQGARPRPARRHR